MIKNNNRIHYMDGVRVTFAFMGIMFHMAIWYVLHPQDLPSLKAVDYSRTLFWVIEVIRLFRMDTFFLIAGFFAAMGLVKVDFSAFMKQKIKRLNILNIVPAVFILTTLISYLLQLSFGGVGPLSARYWSSLVFEHHLWFLEVLFIYYFVYGLLIKKPDLINVLHNNLQNIHVLLIGFVYLAWALLAKAFPILWSDNLLMDTIFKLFIYLPYFMLGAAMYYKKELADNFMKFSWFRIWLSIMLILVHLYCIDKKYGVISVYDESVFVFKLIAYLAQGFASLGAVYLIFLVSSNLFKSDSRLLKYLGDRSYTVYLIHFPLCLIFGYCFTKVNLDVRLEYFVSVFSIYVITLLMHDVLVRLIHSKTPELKSSVV